MMKKILLTGLTLSIQISALIAQHSRNNLIFSGNSYDNWKSSTQIVDGFMTNDLVNSIRLQPDQIAIKSKVLVNVQATDFLIVFNLIQSGETASLTNELIGKRMSSFKDDLTALGVNDTSMFIDMIYMIPIFEKELAKKLFNKNKIEVPTSFEMQKNIHIRFKDLRWVDIMVALAAQNEIYDIAKLDYFMNDQIAATDTVQSLAVSQIQKRINLYKKLNLDLSVLSPIVRDKMNIIYPGTQYTEYEPYVSTSHYLKSSNTLKVHRPKAVSYDQVPYKEFDIIIDPILLEPVIQISYEMIAIYTIKKEPIEQEKPKDRLFYLTPEGEMRPINLNLR